MPILSTETQDIDAMSNNSILEERLEALELEVAAIKRKLGNVSSNGNWVDEIAGSMKQFPEFGDVVRLGREIRDSIQDPEE